MSSMTKHGVNFSKFPWRLILRIVFSLNKKSHDWPNPKVLQINLHIPFMFNQHFTLMSYTSGIGHVSSHQTYMETNINFLVFRQVYTWPILLNFWNG
jgi:hypothetical protein